MPFTPYHFGPALLAGVILFPLFDIVAMMIACVALDIEPMLVLFLGLGGPLHGMSHTYLVATIVSFIVTGILWILREQISVLADAFGVLQEPNKIRILAASLFGTYSHVLLDSFLYGEMNPFFPILGNPFLRLVAPPIIHQFCLYCGMIGIVLYFVRFWCLRRDSDSQITDPFT